MDASSIGRLLVYAGLALAALGGLVLVLSRWVDLGGLPGDIAYEGENVRVYLPLGTMLLLSLVLTLVLNLVLRLFR
jgi:hypothetical protein